MLVGDSWALADPLWLRVVRLVAVWVITGSAEPAAVPVDAEELPEVGTAGAAVVQEARVNMAADSSNAETHRRRCTGETGRDIGTGEP